MNSVQPRRRGGRGIPAASFAFFKQPGVARPPKEGEQVRESGRHCQWVRILANAR